jgi:hypothetical protein
MFVSAIFTSKVQSSVLADLGLNDSNDYFLDRRETRSDEIPLDSLKRLRILEAFGKLMSRGSESQRYD